LYAGGRLEVPQNIYTGTIQSQHLQAALIREGLDEEPVSGSKTGMKSAAASFQGNNKTGRLTLRRLADECLKGLPANIIEI